VAFTVCQTPVVYCISQDGTSVAVTYRDGRVEQSAGDTLPVEVAREVFNRTGEIERIDVQVAESSIRD